MMGRSRVRFRFSQSKKASVAAHMCFLTHNSLTAYCLLLTAYSLNCLLLTPYCLLYRLNLNLNLSLPPLSFDISPFASKLGQNFLDEGTDLWEIIQKSIDTVARFRGKTIRS
jgi:hypothetical protein